jgi:hypothetical protein
VLVICCPVQLGEASSGLVLASQECIATGGLGPRQDDELHRFECRRHVLLSDVGDEITWKGEDRSSASIGTRSCCKLLGERLNLIRLKEGFPFVAETPMRYAVVRRLK